LRVPLPEEAEGPGRHESGGKAGGGTPRWANVAAGVCSVLLVAAIVWILIHVFRSNLTLENYQKLKVGMTEAEVTSILGSPNRGKQSMTSTFPGQPIADYWTYTEGTKTVTVIFADGKVVELKSNLEPTTPPPQ
jgi:hypothetical protein